MTARRGTGAQWDACMYVLVPRCERRGCGPLGIGEQNEQSEQDVMNGKQGG